MSTIRSNRAYVPTKPPAANVVDTFRRAVSAKRAGKLDDAIALLDQALATQPDYLAGRLARAGYQALTGDVDGAREMFAAIDVPPPGDGQSVNADGFTYHMNATWFSALVGDDDAAIAHAAQVLEQVPGDGAKKPLAEFFASEPDLQRLQSHPKVVALLTEPPAAAAFSANAPAHEAGTASDFVTGQGSPSGGTSPLHTRLAAAQTEPTISADAEAALDAMAALIPSPQSASMGPLHQLAGVINRAVREAQLEGKTDVSLEPSQLDALLAEDVAGYGAIASMFESMGAKTFVDGFTGVSVSWEQAPATADKSQVLADLTASVTLPGEVSPQSAGAQLGSLVQAKIAEAASRGDDMATLETNELDPLVRPLKLKYKAVAEKLKSLGFKAGADGFTGVSFLWPMPDNKTVDSNSLGQLAALLAPPRPLAPAEHLGALVEAAVQEALSKKDNIATLDTNDLTPVLKQFGGDLNDVADALTKAGFKTSADGFVGVMLSWGT